MDIRIYAGFVAAAELSSITLAAQRLNITQPALSRQIRALEDSLGIKLFEKSGRNVRLTAAGEVLYSRVNEVLVADRDLRAVAGDLAQSQTGVLKIGSCAQLIERYLPRFLHDWRAANPGIDIRLEDGGGPELVEKLHAGTVQITLSAMPSAPIEIFETVRLGALAFIAVATREFLDPSSAPVEIGEVLRHPILTLNCRHASREVFDAACRLSGAVPRIVLESTSPHTLFSMAEGGNGVAVVPSSVQPDREALVARQIALRGESVVFDICAMHDSRVPLPAYGRRFIDDLRAHILAEGDGSARPATKARSHLHIV